MGRARRRNQPLSARESVSVRQWKSVVGVADNAVETCSCNDHLSRRGMRCRVEETGGRAR
eukprot:1243207-Prymnesium_polylepis.1